MWDRDSLKNTHCSFPPTERISFLQAFLAVVFYCLDNLQSLWLSVPCLNCWRSHRLGELCSEGIQSQSLSSEIVKWLLLYFLPTLLLLPSAMASVSQTWTWVFHFLMASVLKHNFHSSKKVPGFSKDIYPESKSPSRDSFWDLDPDLPFL